MGVLPLSIRDAPPTASSVDNPSDGSHFFRCWIPHSNRSDLVLLHVHESNIAQHMVVLYLGSIFLLPLVLFHLSPPQRVLESRCQWQEKQNTKRHPGCNEESINLCQSRYDRPQDASLLDLFGRRYGKIYGPQERLDLERRSTARSGHICSAHSLRSAPLRLAGPKRSAPYDTGGSVCGNILRTGRPAGVVPGQCQNREHCYHGYLPDASRNLSFDSKLESLELCGMLFLVGLSSIRLGGERECHRK